MADQVLYSGVACITDLMVKEGLINLDFADVRAVMKEMGKAMMGTGEASGEKRSITAAEAAIANPLIDDASMKGAKGLLVSITGGKDLTLYEVDEAATRIRGEVDPEANIIVGATFDESLEGVIRVSVVATGIDNVGQAQRPTPAEARAAEITGKIRHEAKRTAERVAREAQPMPAVAQTPAATEAAHAAVAAAILPATAIEDVSIRPMPMKPSLFEAPIEETPVEPSLPKAFIPPAAERPVAPVRMPRIDELPIPAQNEIKAQRGELSADHPEKRRMSLMQRLASVGLGGRKDEIPQPPQTAHHQPAPNPVQMAKRPVRPAQQRPAEVSEYARRPTPQGLDLHGRPAPVQNASEDDQLEIPAFLRRQAN
jgi:cell division protein FtsZ